MKEEVPLILSMGTLDALGQVLDLWNAKLQRTFLELHFSSA